jgi:hypothetical protein
MAAHLKLQMVPDSRSGLKCRNQPGFPDSASEHLCNNKSNGINGIHIPLDSDVFGNSVGVILQDMHIEILEIQKDIQHTQRT